MKLKQWRKTWVNELRMQTLPAILFWRHLRQPNAWLGYGNLLDRQLYRTSMTPPAISAYSPSWRIRLYSGKTTKNIRKMINAGKYYETDGVMSGRMQTDTYRERLNAATWKQNIFDLWNQNCGRHQYHIRLPLWLTNSEVTLNRKWPEQTNICVTGKCNAGSDVQQ